MYISYEIRTKFVWSSCEVHMNRKFLLHMYFKWSSCELHMKFICNYVWNIEVAMIFICISFEVHMTHRPELSNEISYEWYEPSVVHWGRDKIFAISQTFSNAFSWMKRYEFRVKFHWSLFLRFELTIIHALIQIMGWRRPGDKPLFEPMIVSLLTHICVARPQWVKSALNNAFLHLKSIG